MTSLLYRQGRWEVVEPPILNCWSTRVKERCVKVMKNWTSRMCISLMWFYVLPCVQLARETYLKPPPTSSNQTRKTCFACHSNYELCQWPGNHVLRLRGVWTSLHEVLQCLKVSKFALGPLLNPRIHGSWLHFGLKRYSTWIYASENIDKVGGNLMYSNRTIFRT